MASYLLKAADERMKGWKSAAKAVGQTFAEWLRDAAEAHAARSQDDVPEDE